MKKHSFLKITLPFFVLLMFFYSCEKEMDIPMAESIEEQQLDGEEGQFIMSSTDLEDVPKITDFLNKRAGKNILFGKAGESENDGGAIMSEDVLKVIDSIGHSNYSFRFTFPESSENEFYNLVVGESPDGSPQDPMVFHYVCDPEHFQEFQENDFDPTYFVGTVSMHTFDSIFNENSFSKDTCAQHDQYGDPIPCIRTTVTNGGSSGGNGGSAGGAPSSGGFAQPSLSSYSLTATVYHVTPDGRTFRYGSGSTCHHPGECQVIFQVGNKRDQKAIDRTCSKCPTSSGGIVTNTGSRTKLLVNSLKSKLSLSSTDQAFLLRNSKLVDQLNKYLARHKNSSQAKTKVKSMISEAKVGALVSVFPYIKYPKSKAKEYSTKYPRLTTFLKNELPKIANNEKIINSIHGLTDAPKETIKQALQWGKGPELQVIQLGGSGDSEVYGAYRGHVNPSLKNTLFLDIDLAKDLENLEKSAKFTESIAFLIAVTILHEYTHFGDTVFGDSFWGDLHAETKADEDEVGIVFEKEIFGETVWRSNAGLLMTKNKLN